MIENQGLVGQEQNNHNMGDESNPCYESSLRACGCCCGFFNTWICPCAQSAYYRVPEGFVGVVQEFGKFSRLYEAGLYYINPCTEKMTMVDKREKIMDIRQQICMTKDNLNIIVDAVIYYQIEDSYKSLFSIGDLKFGLFELCHTALRDVFGFVTLQEALEDRDKLANHLKEHMDEPCQKWGVHVTRCLVQEILFTEELQKSLSTAATAKRLAESKIIAAQADVQAARLMKKSADILNTPAAMQVRYLEALAGLGKVSNPKVLFFPSDYKQVGGQSVNLLKGNNVAKK
jgi:erythrocyte band 7 integral membrane protein